MTTSPEDHRRLGFIIAAVLGSGYGGLLAYLLLLVP